MSEILGALFAVMIGVYMLSGVIAPQQATNDTVRAIATAQQQKKVYSAAAQYIEQNSAAITSAATATNPVIVTVPMLQAAGMNLSGVSATNPYGQTWQVQILQPSANNLQALVMSVGGDALQDKIAALVAKYVGGSGGFIPRNDTGIYTAGSSQAYGTYAGWQIPTAYYSGVSGGHPAALLTVVNGQVSNNYLYRNAVPGQPQLNMMNTALGMLGNDINAVGTLTGKQANLSRDGTLPCCNPNGATLNLAEASSTTGRRPTIQFHAQNQAEGFVELDGNGGAPRLNLRNNQGVGLGMDASGVITAPAVIVPNGANLRVGSSAVDADSNDTAIRQNGALYISHYDNSAASIGRVADVNSYNGTVTTNRDWFGFYARDSAGNDVASAKSGAGSMNVNDIYIRSIGKWASELGGGDNAYLAQNGYTTLPSGLIMQWGYYPYQLTYNSQQVALAYPKPFPHAAFSCNVTPGYTGLTNDNGPLTMSSCGYGSMTVANTSDAVPVNGFYWFAIGW